MGTGESFILPVQFSLYYSEVLVKGPGHGLRIEDVLAALRDVLAALDMFGAFG